MRGEDIFYAADVHPDAVGFECEECGHVSEAVRAHPRCGKCRGTRLRMVDADGKTVFVAQKVKKRAHRYGSGR